MPRQEIPGTGRGEANRLGRQPVQHVTEGLVEGGGDQRILVGEVVGEAGMGHPGRPHDGSEVGTGDAILPQQAGRAGEDAAAAALYAGARGRMGRPLRLCGFDVAPHPGGIKAGGPYPPNVRNDDYRKSSFALDPARPSDWAPR
nr:hypothetical protein [Paracraurococcus ruber]